MSFSFATSTIKVLVLSDSDFAFLKDNPNWVLNAINVAKTSKDYEKLDLLMRIKTVRQGGYGLKFWKDEVLPHPKGSARLFDLIPREYALPIS